MTPPSDAFALGPGVLTIEEPEINGTRRWSMKVDISREMPEEVYEMVGRRMAATLEEVLRGGWRVVAGPEVTETYDFLRNMSTITATVTLTVD